MYKITALVAVAVALCAMATTAHAGKATIDSSGNFLVLDASFSPPATSSSKTRQGVVLEMHHMYGNFRGNPTPTEASNINFKLPKGTVVNQALFARCPVPTAETLGDESRCPPASKMGSGTASVDARRSGLPDQLNGTVNVYNGASRNGVPTLALIATIPVPGAAEPIKAELDFEIRKGPNLVEYDTVPPTSANASFDITSFGLTVGKTVNGVLNGKKARISFFEAPKTCKKSWAFELGLTRASQGSMIAKDTAPCLRVTG
jgi:hypothetical protein